MAKKPIYRYQYKPQAISYFKPKLGEKEELAKSVGTQVTNLEKRFQGVGVPTETGKDEVDKRNLIQKALNLKADQGIIMDILEVMNRPTQVVTNILSSLGDQDKRNVLTAAWEGLSGQKEIGARQALVNLTGDQNLLKLKKDDKSTFDDIGQAVIDLGLEIAFDPTTYFGWGMITKGAGKVAKPVIKQADTMARSFAKGIINSLPEASAKKAMDFVRGTRNLITKTGYLFDALKDIGKGLRFELDKVFGTANSKLKGIKSGIKALDEKVEPLVREYADVARKGFDPKSVERAQKTLETSKGAVEPLEASLKKAQEELADSTKKLSELAVPPSRGRYAKQGKEAYRKARVALQNKIAKSNSFIDETTEAISKAKTKVTESEMLYEKLSKISKMGPEEYYRRAIFDLYEAGYKFGPDGRLITAGADVPRGVLDFDDVAEDIGSSKRKFTYESREMSTKDANRVYNDIKDSFRKINDGLGGNYLRVSRIGNYLTINLGFDEITGLTDEAKKALKTDILKKAKDALRAFEAGATGSKKITTGAIVISKEAKELLGRSEKLKEIFEQIENVERATADLYQTTTSGFKYQAQDIYKGKLPEQMRYVRRVRTREFIEKLKSGTKYDALPALREVVSSTGKELDERLYRGTAREYNKLKRLLYSEVGDEFGQDIVKSLTDYARVAESRFSMAEITRVIFGLDVDKIIDEEELTKMAANQAGKVKGMSVDVARQEIIDSGRAPMIDTFTQQEFSQAEQFLKPVDEIVDPVTKKVTKSNVVTKEMADEFLKKNPQYKILNDGFVYFDEAGNIAGGEFESLFKSLPKNLQGSVKEYLEKGGMLGKNMTVHTNVYSMLKGAQNAYKVNLPEAITLFDKILSKWKEITLISPAFHIRNAIGNWSNMWLAGMNNGEILGETANAMKQLAKRDELMKKLASGTITAQEEVALKTMDSYVTSLSSTRGGFRDLDELVAARKFDPGIDNKLGGKFKDGYQKLVDANFKMSERADEIQRLALYNWHRKKGLAAGDALQKVRETLFDYGKLTPFEKGYMKRFFPFYTFMKENLAFQFKNMLAKPDRYKNLFRTYKHYLEAVVDVEAEDLPKYMTGNFWLPIPFNVNKDDKDSIAFLKANLPATDFLEFIENPLKKGASSIAVPIKATWEFLSGIDTFTGAPIKGFEGQKSVFKGDSAVGFLRNEKGEFDISKDPTIKKFADDLGLRTVRRPFTLLLDSIDTIMGKQNPENFALDLLEQSGFVTTKSKQDINLNSLYQQLEYLRNLKKLYEQNTGQDLPTIRQLDDTFGYKFKG